MGTRDRKEQADENNSLDRRDTHIYCKCIMYIITTNILWLVERNNLL